MKRVIETKESAKVGKCIYCGATGGKLSEEHVTPFGLGGKLTLLEASCASCAKITSSFESTVLRNMFFAARAALGTPTRRPKERLKPQPMLVEKAGQVQRIEVPWQDQWKVIELPIFRIPAHIDGRHYTTGIECISMDMFELTERREEIARRHRVDTVLPGEYRMEDYARFIAKMAYGYAVEKYGLAAFEEVYVLSAIIGQSDDVGRWVGSPHHREFPVRPCNISVGYKIIPGDELLIRIKMFPRFDGAEYVVVIGKVKESY